MTDRRMTAETDDPLLRAFLRGLAAAGDILVDLQTHAEMSRMGGPAALRMAADALREVARNPDALLRAREGG